MRYDPTLSQEQIDRIRSVVQLWRIQASETDGHDYLVNMLSLHELIAQNYAALKQNHTSDEDKSLFIVGDLHLDASRY